MTTCARSPGSPGRSPPATYANLALLGDKHFPVQPRAFGFHHAYGVARRSWVALGDPVGSPRSQTRVALEVSRTVRSVRRANVFYQVSDESMPHYLDLGLSFVKLGEEAGAVNRLLAGRKRPESRCAQTSNRFHRENCSFEILDVAAVRNRMAELRAVSDAWMGAEEHVREGVSHSASLPDYIQRFPVAIVHREVILAFTNLWLKGSGKQELSIDLMRYVQGFRGHGLPVHGVDALGARRRLSVVQSRHSAIGGIGESLAGALWHRFGEPCFSPREHFYNFQGLRHYKEKFEPDWHLAILPPPASPCHRFSAISRP